MSSGSRSSNEPPGPLDPEHRLAFFAVEAGDGERLRALGPLTAATVDGIVEEFYDHLLTFPDLRPLLLDDPDRLARLKAKQREYFLTLTEGRFDAAYFESRLRVGDTHQQVGLAPVWYMGAFSLYLRLALRALVEHTGDGTQILPTIESFIKAIFLDMSLAMNTYISGGFVGRNVAQELERAARVAEEALAAQAEVERMKDDLTRMVVHDLKNPVSGIAMMVQLALRKGTALPETQRSYLLQIDRTCREMMRLIQNLLEISKIEEGRMPVARELVELRPLAEEVAVEYAPVAEQAGRVIDIRLDATLPAAMGDRALLRRVLVNLVVNALRHSGSPDVLIDGVRGPGPAELTLRVIDHGHGIDVADQAAIFEKFRTFRRSPSDDPASDTGLGLPFCRLAVERMGGSIAVHSDAGTTEFAVVLPAHADPAA